MLIGDPADRDAVAAAVLRRRDEAGEELAGVIDTLTLQPAQRRGMVRILAEIDA